LRRYSTTTAAVIFGLVIPVISIGADPIVVADFEGADYGKWTTTGTAFGAGPAHGTLEGQMHVDGFQGKGLVNSFQGGDDATGRLTSPPFKIERKFITFLIGGGGWVDETCMNLIINDNVVRTAIGPNTQAGNTERLNPAAWDVAEFSGRDATLEIVDSRKGGWGHINIDQIVMTDDRGSLPLVIPPVPLAKNVTREVVAEKKLLHFPVKTGAKLRVVTVKVDGAPVRRFDIELADDKPEWWAPLDVSEWNGKTLTIVADALPVDSKALDSIRQSDTLLDSETLYREPLRSQFHFSPRRGWTNDPNGLVYFNGEYHLFFQHNPYGWNWGNMHWGHATSPDLVHWKEHGEALYPDDMGPMFSGSAVVDWKNTSGFGKDGKPPLVLIYTAAGNPTVQGIAYSVDGRTFTKYGGNPVIKQVSPGNRDPKVLWHEPTKQWVLVLYVEAAGKKHTIHIYNSPNLREWSLTSIVEGGIDADKYLFECPDLFELAVDGNPSNKKWVINAANSEYAIGQFDGKVFTPEVSRLMDVRGRGFYAAQTFSDVPDGRRIQIGWSQAPSPGMSFNQLQTIPISLSLRSTKDGIRLSRTPVKELELLRDGPNRANSLSDFRSELIEFRAEFEPGTAENVEFQLRGAILAYDIKKEELSVNGHRVPAPLIDGQQRLTIFVDRTMLEVFASDGLVYVPMPFIPKSDDQSVKVDSKRANVEMKSLQVYSLKSCWTSR
jgi:fructan beta-fructosidase